MGTISLALALAAAAPLAGRPATPATFASDVTIGAPVQDGNLTLFPLTPRRRAAADADAATLDEALRAKALAVEEVSAAGTVNALRVENNGDRPVLLVAGELLLGGKQDRIVGRSMVLAPRSRQEVPVFCVEHGRWSGPGAFESGGAMGHVALRKAALDGGQREVWEEVARANARLGTANRSDTYRAAASKLQGEGAGIARRLSEALARTGGAAGIAVAIDGEVVAVEWFASPRVFERVREKLVGSYVAQAQEARAAAPAGAAPAASPPPAAVTDFAARAEKGEAIVERVRATGDGAAVQTTYLKR